MDTSSWRFRVLLEPRGFIRVIEVILAIVAFATTGGYSSITQYSISCGAPNFTVSNFGVDISYPFRLNAQNIIFHNCSGGEMTTKMDGDFSPSAEWFMFVGTTAFLYSLAATVFYVVFDASIRLTHDRLVTVGDLAVTVLYSFFWLTAASAWAWGVGQVGVWSGTDRFFQNEPLDKVCHSGVTCVATSPTNLTPLNASVAFGFLNFFLWCCNVWFAYKESPYHQEPSKSGSAAGISDPPPNNM